LTFLHQGAAEKPTGAKYGDSHLIWLLLVDFSFFERLTGAVFGRDGR
jgi:hypothetical protein